MTHVLDNFARVLAEGFEAHLAGSLHDLRDGHPSHTSCPQDLQCYVLVGALLEAGLLLLVCKGQ